FVAISRRLADALTGLLMFRRLQDSERKLEEAQRIAHVGHWESDFETGALTLSDEACRILGLQPHDVAQWQGRFHELVHPDDRSRVVQALATADGGASEADLEYRVVRPDGEVRTVLARREVKQPEAGRPWRQFGMVQDITELRRAEEARLASEMRFRTFVDFAADAFFLQDDSGTLIDVNRQACMSLGYGRHELIGMHPRDFDPDVERGMRRNIGDRLVGEQVVSFESRNRRKDGTEFPVEVRVRGFEQGGRRFRVSLARDISERKEAEAARARLEEELRRAQKMEAIGTLAGGIAHDFNNILGAILGYGEIAQWKAADGRAIDDELEQVMQAGERGKRLVEHILAFSRTGAGDSRPVRVQSVVAETLRLLAASLPAGVRLEQRLDAGDAAISGDATQLHQVAMNLCTNAIQAMPSGGVLSVSLDRMEVTQPRTISHGMLERGSYVRLEVSDTGTGIPPAALDRIFDPFFTTKGVGKGTGLGLSLVHGIVTDYHGAIEVTTREGVGTTFGVWLPHVGEMSEPAEGAIEALSFGEGESVMIVDDERPLVRLAEETLAKLGYDPAGFDSSVAALEAFRTDPDRYDMVLTDATMPELTGTDLAREIHRLRADVPIVLMSGYQGPQLTELAQAAGVCDILRKPLVSRDLARSMARARTLLRSSAKPVA
ncbi:MAG TPA: PAS domain S-box protein, partial [Caldimonas sp.]|nr:PAS domain S-box protein [Caldimonas sp.]